MRQLVAVSDYSFPSLLASSAEDDVLVVIISLSTAGLIFIICYIVWWRRQLSKVIAHAHEIGRIRCNRCKHIGLPFMFKRFGDRYRPQCSGCGSEDWAVCTEPEEPEQVIHKSK